MAKIKKYNLQEAVERWSQQVKAVASFTESDSEEFKYGLLDMVDDFKSKGLDDEEAFLIASGRFNMIYGLEGEFEKVNMPKLQMRRITQVLSGVMIFFLLFFLMHSTSKLLFLALSSLNDNVLENMKYIYYYILIGHFFIVIIAVILYFFGRKSLKRIESIKIKPKQLFWIYLDIICLAGLNFWLFQIIKSNFTPPLEVIVLFNSIIHYSSYSFPLVFIISFILLYQKYYTISFEEEGQTFIQQVSPVEENISTLNKVIQEDQHSELVKIGLKGEEVLLVTAKRAGLRLTQHDGKSEAERPFKASLRLLLIVLSGVLFYFLLYYFLHASSRILITVLQHFKNEPSFSIRWTWWYVIAYHMMFIFFITSIYIKDVNLIRKIEGIKIKPRHTIWILFSTVLLAAADRIFFPFSRNEFGSDPVIFLSVEKIFFALNYSLPLIVSTCLLFLFRKYYRDNMKIG
jgi:hypothetical protein